MVTSVLVVDDDQQVRDLIGAVLLDDRISLEYASSLQTGASMLQTRRFDLAILDSIMSDHPDPDLAALAANENTPILFMTRDATDTRILERTNHCFIEKKFIRDGLLEQFSRILFETRGNTAGAKVNKARPLGNAEALVNAISASGQLEDAITAERSRPSVGHTLLADDAVLVPQAGENRDPVVPASAQAASPGVTGHLGTLVRHRRSGTYEVRFSLDADRSVVVATCNDKPVSLDFNATVREMVSLGQTIFTRSAWLQKQGTLVRRPADHK